MTDTVNGTGKLGTISLRNWGGENIKIAESSLINSEGEAAGIGYHGYGITSSIMYYF